MRNLIVKSILILSDIISLLISFYLSIFIYTDLAVSLYDFVFVIFVLVILFYFEKIYDFRYDFWQETSKIFRAFVLGFLISFSLFALMQTEFRSLKSFIIFLRP